MKATAVLGTCPLIHPNYCSVRVSVKVRVRVRVRVRVS